MSNIREKLAHDVINKANTSIDIMIYCINNIKITKQIILADKSLTNDEKTYAVRKIDKTYDKNKILFNSGILYQLETVWNDGKYEEWDFKEKQLKRIGELLDIH
ncbi:hypothetical protein RhiirA4_468437 [Rhizophagus irregularis]|uniref:Uncharacterized protein n=1 Tax=Rhizophagus irregularis TaxID=588596 RepID=A0A2I1GY08_9GLOM|nr:hypothetical protein RhiirA4_468437 [Rhizophagus irregularis]